MRATPRTISSSLVLTATLVVSGSALAQQPLPPPGGAAPAAPPPAGPAAPPPPAGGAGWGFTADSSGASTSSKGSAPAAAPASADDDYAYRLAANTEMTTISGSTGLLRVANATSAPVGTFRLQVLWDYFSASSFLCNSATPCRTHQNDSVSHFGSVFTASATLFSFLEGYMGVRSYANSNDQGQPQLLQVLGDMTLGFKAFLPAERYRMFNVGLDGQMLLLNGAGGVGLDGGSTSFRARGLFTADFRQPNGGGIPLLAHLNAGYRFDNSGSIVKDTETKRGGAPIERVERFGLGINRVDFGEIGIGLEALIAGGETLRWVRPFAEYTIDVPINRQKYSCNPNRTASGDECLGNQSSMKVAPSRATLGVRANPFLNGLVLTVAGDLGVTGTSTFIEEVAPQAPWTFWFGAGYSFDTVERPPVVKTEKVREVIAAPVTPTYALRGTVHENGQTAGIGGAIVMFQGRDMTGMVTDGSGKFVTANLEPGSYTFTVKADGYKEGTCTATVTAAGAPMPPPADPNAPGAMGTAPSTGPGSMGAPPPMAPPPPSTGGPMITDVDCVVESMPKLGTVSGSIQSGEGGGVAGATVTLTDANGKERTATTDGSGNFRIDGLTPGAVKLRASQADFMGGGADANVEPRKDARVVITMNKRPKNSQVTVGKKEIIIKQQVHFETDSAKIMSDSTILLEELADVLNRTPRIKSVEIQGHTDNQGSAAHNRLLSEQRAAAVRDRLVALGVSSSRLQAKGFGAERPIVPNVTAGNRARNRRVALIILEQDK
jgi:outer membrane protein OmpA-like peptidoglycan-associated protein